MTVRVDRTFRVRHYECDAYENVYYTNYLRYVQETAMDASASVGYDGAWYTKQGTIWLVRETDIEYLHPLRYGDTVKITTWVENFRHAVSRRAYELRLTGSDDLVARAGTEWVYLDAARGKPIRIPDEFKTSFFPDGPPPNPPPRERFPHADPPSHGVFRQRRRVEWRDIDPAQHVNNSVYLAYAEDAAVEASMALDWSPARMREHGFTIQVRRHRIEYKIPAVLGDDLEISTWLTSRTDRSAQSSRTGETTTRHFQMVRLQDGALVARALAEVAWVDATTGADIPIPEAYRNVLT